MRNISRRNQLGFSPVIIILFGLVVAALAGAYWFFGRGTGNNETVYQAPSPASSKQLTLTITNPTNESLAADKKVTVAGTTLPNINVAIFTDSDDTVVQSDTQGYFTGVVSLETGLNTLTITAFGDNNEQKSVSMDVVYDDQS